MNRLGNNFVDGTEEKSMEHQESMEKAIKKKKKRKIYCPGFINLAQMIFLKPKSRKENWQVDRNKGKIPEICISEKIHEGSKRIANFLMKIMGPSLIYKSL